MQLMSVGYRDIKIGELYLGGGSTSISFRAFSRDEDTQGVMAIEEKGTGPIPGLLSKLIRAHPHRAYCSVWFCI